MNEQPSLYVLSPDVYVAGSTHLSGPPAAIFNAYVAQRERIRFVVSPWIRDRLRAGLVEEGFDEELADEQTRFVMSLCEWKDLDDDLDEPLLALARAAGVDAVYGGEGHGDADGVRFASVSDLIAELGALYDVEPGSTRLVGTTLTGELVVRELRRDAEALLLKNRSLVSIDLSGLGHMRGLKQIQLDGNPLERLDLEALGDIPGLAWVSIVCPDLRELDLAPLARCNALEAIALHPATRALGVDELAPETCVLRQTALTGRLADDSAASWRFAAEARTVRLAFEDARRRSSRSPIEQIDLAPLRWLEDLTVLDLSGNALEQLDLAPLGGCRRLRHIRLCGSPLGELDVTPLFACADLQRFEVDPDVRLHARWSVRERPLPPAFRRLVHRIDWR